MMHFGNFRSPWLLSALASLLSTEYGQGMRGISGKLYLMAEQQSVAPLQKRFYALKAEQMFRLWGKTGTRHELATFVATVKTEIQTDLKQGKRFMKVLRLLEKKAERSTNDPDAYLYNLWYRKAPYSVAKILLLPTDSFAKLLSIQSSRTRAGGSPSWLDDLREDTFPVTEQHASTLMAVPIHGLFAKALFSAAILVLLLSLIVWGFQWKVRRERRFYNRMMELAYG